MKKAAVLISVALLILAFNLVQVGQVDRKSVKETLEREMCKEIIHTPLVYPGANPTQETIALQRVIIIQQQKILEDLDELKKKN